MIKNLPIQIVILFFLIFFAFSSVPILMPFFNNYSKISQKFYNMYFLIIISLVFLPKDRDIHVINPYNLSHILLLKFL